MRQYNQIKAKYPDAILLFRVGDFYETFGDDAIRASQILGIVLTKRANGTAAHIELAGFPHHSLDVYLPKLVRAGQRVAICDQLEDPKLTKKIVKRGVTELVSPGVSYNDKVLEVKQNNYLASVFLSEGIGGVSFLDISTGEFFLAEGKTDYLDKLLQGLKPAEVLVSKPQAKEFVRYFGDKFYTFLIDDWVFTDDYANEKLLKHFETQSLKGFGVDKMKLGIVAAGAALHYLHENQHRNIAHIASVSRLEEDKYVWLDTFTVRNLELVHSANEHGVPLLYILDHTLTPMGARLLRRWMVMPLKEQKLIEERLDVVEQFTKNEHLALEVAGLLKQVGDLERLVSKVAMKRVNPRELMQLNRSLKIIEPLKQLLMQTGHLPVTKVADQLQPCFTAIQRLEQVLVPEPPALLNKGSVIADGVHTELDELRKIAYSGKDYLLQIQQRESQRTGIPSLKISYNNVFGYYLEVTNAHKDKVPTEWIRKQTLVNAERYITQELKEYEEKILGAEEKIFAIEERLFNELVIEMSEYVTAVQQNALQLARIDSLLSFATVALRNNYVKPELNDSFELMLKDCRHPVIERQLPPGEPYIPNDIYLDNAKQQVIILTGPNMSGKSAVLRQTALAVLMAQIGCFVPATYARIGLIDKVFTRVGASDNLSSGESTFMVEMTETASILNNLSPRSLILLDEIGRGTSTYDGVSLAWSITEYLTKVHLKPKTLFATHYHELNELEGKLDGIKNYHVAVKETGNKVIFLRKLKEGGSEHSFGIHVARMAGIPKDVLRRAEEILRYLEDNRSPLSGTEAVKKLPPDPFQLHMFQLSDPLVQRVKEELQKVETDSITPLEALMKLHYLKKIIEGK
ncbi:MAG: DNA mismatch repair protein MutS [Bacteroidia bacterium]|nr:DNA mismatch repair protein MutS [Bacteroidia bacterium]